MEHKKEADSKGAQKRKEAMEAVLGATHVLVGIGAGVSASGGHLYTNPALVDEWFPEYKKWGVQTLVDLQGLFWHLKDEESAPLFWGYWARHIQHCRYLAPLMPVYADIARLLDSRPRDRWFVHSTNVDGQLKIAGVDHARVFAPQGEYAAFQCIKPCSDEVYDNRAMIDAMVAGMEDCYRVRKELVPHCPRCGDLLVPNLRSDDRFVEAPYMGTLPTYREFLRSATAADTRLVLLELGVGFNSPGAIRFPFEEIVRENPAARLVRVNLTEPQVSPDIAARSFSIADDITHFMADLVKML